MGTVKLSVTMDPLVKAALESRRTHYSPLTNQSYCTTCGRDNPDTKTCGHKGSECALRNLFKRSKLARQHRDAYKRLSAKRPPLSTQPRSIRTK